MAKSATRRAMTTTPRSYVGYRDYLGNPEEVRLNVSLNRVRSITAKHDGVSVAEVTARITGHEDLDTLVFESLMAIRVGYEQQLSMEPNDDAEKVWEDILRDLWAQALVP